MLKSVSSPSAHPSSDRHQGVGVEARNDGEEAQPSIESQKRNGSSPSVTSICEALQELQVRRRFLVGLRVRQTNACGALIRRGMGFSMKLPEAEREKLKKHAAAVVAAYFANKEVSTEDQRLIDAYGPILAAVAEALEPLLAQEDKVIRAMEELAKQLPVAAWVKTVKGFGDRGLGVIIGETGDLAAYPNFRHVWKRLGLAPYDGAAGSTWRSPKRRERSLNEEEWTALGYRPSRRAEVHAFICEPMSRRQLRSAEKSGTPFGEPLSRYGEIYVQRREQTAVAHPEWSAGHARDDALRIMAKKVIADLWQNWRSA